MEETKIIQFDNMTSFEAMCILGIEDKNLKDEIYTKFTSNQFAKILED